MPKTKEITLSDIPKGSQIKINLQNEQSIMVTFDHIDGMYSYCFATAEPEKLLHLAGWTPLKKVDDYYVIDSE